MPTETLDAKPRRFGIEAFAGKTHTVTVAFPLDFEMAGDWTAWVAKSPLDVDHLADLPTLVAGQEVAFQLTEAQTTALARKSGLTLYIAQDGEVIFAPDLFVELRGSSTPTTQSVQAVTTGNVVIEVSLVGGSGGDTGAALVVQGNLDTHSAKTTNVHGIPDTSVLATDAEVATAVAAEATARANADTTEAATRAAADTALDGRVDDLEDVALTEDEADDIYRRQNVPLVDGDIPSAIARDSEVSTAVGAEATLRTAADTAEVTARNVAIGVETAARVAADLLLIPLTQKGAANGVAPLDGNVKIPVEFLPSLAITDAFAVDSQAEMLALPVEGGDIAIRSDISKTFILGPDGDPTDLGDWLEMRTPTDSVASVDGRTGVVSLSDLYDAIGAAATAQAFAIQRGNHTGTQDVSTITGLAEAVQDVVGVLTFGGSGLAFSYDDAGNAVTLDVNVDGATLEIIGDALRVKDGGITLAKLADLAQGLVLGRAAGAGTGPVTALTAAQVKTVLSITEADVSGLTADLAAKAPLASPTFTGTPTVPNQAAADNSTKIANTAYVDTASGLLIPKSAVDGATLELTGGGVLRQKDGGTTLAKMADSVEARVIGRAAGAGTGVPTLLTGAQLKSIAAIVMADISDALTFENGIGTLVNLAHAGFVSFNANVMDEQVFITPGANIWTKPTLFVPKLHLVLVLGASGAGGGGRRGAAGTNRNGGGGGGGAAMRLAWFRPAELGATETATIGAAGVGGGPGGTDTDGSPGTAGGTTSFGTLISILGGSGGAGGTATNDLTGGGLGSLSQAGVFGIIQDPLAGSVNRGGHASYSATAQAGNVPGSGFNWGVGGGGGGGGGISSGNVSRAGGNGGPAYLASGELQAGGIAGAGGVASGVGVHGQVYNPGSGAGGGTNANVSRNGGSASNSFGGGGGGGSAALNGTVPGTGGNGSPGTIIVVTFGSGS